MTAKSIYAKSLTRANRPIPCGKPTLRCFRRWRFCTDGTHGPNGNALLIRKAAECFLRNDEFSESLNSYLFLAREAAAAETPDQVGALGLCAVFEGLVGFLHSHFCAPEQSSEDASFDAVRSELARYANERAASAGGGSGAAASWKRFVGRIQSATALRPADKYRMLVEHFRLPWEKMSPALDAWKKYRNPLSHGKAPSGEVAEDMIVPSRIAGAINVLAAAAIGYSGLAVLSRIEDQFVRLPESLS